MGSAAQILRDIGQAASAAATEGQTRRPLAVFDLDSTLYDLTLRVTSILHDFSEHPETRKRFPDVAHRLKEVDIHRTDWGILEPLARLGIAPDSHSEFLKAAQAAWSQGFFSNRFLHCDQPLEGAVLFVEQCLSLGADVLYLTGRDVARMGEGTVSSLVQHGFPLDKKKSRLVLKPDKSLDDALFKADVIDELTREHDPIWLFENEPVNINAVLARTPSIRPVFIETCHSGLEEVPRHAIRLRHFQSM